MTKEKIYRVYAISDGTVIDHLPGATALKTIRLLKLEDCDLLTVGINFDSKKYGKKDILKIQNRYLTQDEVNKLALLAPSATINIIKNEKIKDKKKVNLPEKIESIVKCSNPKCISNNEHHIKTIFYVKKRQPIRLMCHYCERFMEQKDIILL